MLEKYLLRLKEAYLDSQSKTVFFEFDFDDRDFRKEFGDYLINKKLVSFYEPLGRQKFHCELTEYYVEKTKADNTPIENETRQDSEENSTSFDKTNVNKNKVDFISLIKKNKKTSAIIAIVIIMIVLGTSLFGEKKYVKTSSRLRIENGETLNGPGYSDYSTMYITFKGSGLRNNKQIVYHLSDFNSYKGTLFDCGKAYYSGACYISWNREPEFVADTDFLYSVIRFDSDNNLRLDNYVDYSGVTIIDENIFKK